MNLHWATIAQRVMGTCNILSGVVKEPDMIRAFKSILEIKRFVYLDIMFGTDVSM